MPRLTSGLVVCLLSVTSAIGCGEPPPPPEPPAAPPRPRVELVAPRAVASAHSFDLVPGGDGAVLGWSSPPVPGSRINVIALGPLGQARGGDQAIADRLAIELSMTAEGERIGVAWVAQSSTRSLELVSEAAFAAGGVGSFSPAMGLGLADPTVTPGRGRLALATSDDGAFFVSHRLPPAACTSSPAGMGTTCARLGRRRIDVPDAAGRGDEPLEVPSPCEPFVTGSLRSNGTWFSALCHEREGRPIATVYAIRPSISLAAANEVLPGCAPRALAPTANGAALVAQCDDGLAVAWQDELGRPIGEAHVVTMSATCAGGRPLLSAAALSLPLTAPVGRIEGLLPADLGGEHARAVWTGSAILVARHRPLGEGHAEVALSRWQCEDDRLVRTDL